MALRSVELGLRRQVARRVGGQGTLPKFRGMFVEGNPGDVPPDQFWRLFNVRFKPGGGIKPRQNLRYFNEDPLHSGAAIINSLYDFQTTVPRRLYLLVDGCAGISATVGSSLMWFDHDLDPVIQRGVYYSTATSFPYFASFDGQLHIGLDSALGRFTLINPPYGIEALATSGATQNQPIATFPGFSITNLRSFDSKLFIALDAGAGASKIATWDGVAIRDDLTAIDPPTLLWQWRDLLVAGFGSGSNQIRTRAIGSSPGTWTTVTPGAGTVATEQMVSYKDKLYITDAAENVWVYDGTTLQIARTVTDATMYGLESFAGYLYFSYTKDEEALIGQYDGTTWTNAHKNLTVQSSAIEVPRRLRKYRGDLYVAAIHSLAEGGGSSLVRSQGSDTAGSWSFYEIGAGAVGGIDDMGAF